MIQHSTKYFLARTRDEGGENATGELLFFVDDDNVLNRNAIAELVEKYLSAERIGLLEPIMYDSNGRLWFYGSKASWISPNPKSMLQEKTKEELIETDSIPNVYMVSKLVFKKVGGENWRVFRSHHSELDLVQRLKAIGLKSYIYTKAKTVYDYGSKSGHVSLLRMHDTIKSDMIIEKCYAPCGRYVLFLFFFIPAHFLLHTLIYIPKTDRKKEFYKAYFDGLREGLKYKVIS